MHVTIINAYSWLNKGDAGIVLGTAHALRQVYPRAQLTVVSMTPEADRIPFQQEQIEIISGPFDYIYTPNRSLFWRLGMFTLHALLMLLGMVVVRFQRAAPLFWLPAKTRLFVQGIAAADVVIGVGGGYWTDNSRKAIYFHLLQTIAVLIARRPTVTLGVSLGPFRSRWRSRLVGKVLNRVAAIVVREEESLVVAQEMGIHPEKLHLYADMAFALAPDVTRPPQAKPTGNVLRIGVTARHYLFPHAADPRQAQADYEQTLATALDQLIEEHNAEIIFLPQVIGPETDDDRPVQRRVANLLRRADRVTLLEENLSPLEIIARISTLDLVVATRFHSAIFTMLAHVPVVAIAYEHKTTGIMQLMGLSPWVLPIEQVTAPDLYRRCCEILPQRAAVQQKIAQEVAAMCERALASVTFALAVGRKAQLPPMQQLSPDHELKTDSPR